MKKYKQLIIGIIIGVVVSGLVGVSASILYQASEIGFTPQNSNWKVNNLESALNDLYDKKGGEIGGNISFLDGLMTEDTKTLDLNYESDFDGKILAIVTNVQGKSNYSDVKINEESVNLTDTNSYPSDNFRKLKYAVVDVKSGDSINCHTDSQPGDSGRLAWSYSSCSLYGIS